MFPRLIGHTIYAEVGSIRLIRLMAVDNSANRLEKYLALNLQEIPLDYNKSFPSWLKYRITNDLISLKISIPETLYQLSDYCVQIVDEAQFVVAQIDLVRPSQPNAILDQQALDA